MDLLSDVLRLNTRLPVMESSFNPGSNKSTDALVSQWWRKRVQTLIDDGRPEDAKGLYLEFGEYHSKRLDSGQ